MSTLELVPADHELLTTELEPFSFVDPPVDPVLLAHDMLQTMREKGGIGLSANQVGLPYRVFIMEGAPAFACFNPKVVYASDEGTVMDEACLSFPGLVYKAWRPNSIRVRFQMPNGEMTTQRFNGMSARVFCHEMMHIDGRYPMEGIGRMKMDKALKGADKLGINYHTLGLMKHAQKA